MRAFTLVELLVALALGMIVAFAAFAAFRVAGKCMVTAHNFSRENRVIAQGYFSTMNEADFWFAEDDPYDPSGQIQRRSYDSAGNPVPVGTDYSYGQPFAEVDLTDEFWNFNVADQRTWSRQGEYKTTSFYWAVGSYAQLGCIDHPDPTGECAWMHVVQDRLYASLGWSGYIDYLPSPWTLGYYLGRQTYTPGANPAVPLRTWAGVDPDPLLQTYNSFGELITNEQFGRPMYAFPEDFFRTAMNAYPHFQTSYHAPEKALGRSGVHLFDITTAFAPRPGWTADGAPAQYVRASKGTIVGRDIPRFGMVGEWPALASGMTASLPHVSVGPAGWPELTVRVLRTSDVQVTGRTKATIVVTNPTSGSTHKISFLPIGSTLRGARQQRQWTHWGAALMDY
ncbi:MAG: prepilin-type N-terminal cleavage/methylation domain-containing protein [Planctomycetes bacterium]|nr:prepilin-type N-terminal cleavage/methylation domain-containing protein [Planctomycetota bacterium]